MRRRPARRLIGLLFAAGLTASSCTGGNPHVSPTPSTGRLPYQRGGTLRVTLFAWLNHEFDSRTDDGRGDYTLDPQREDFNVTWELFRCCLLRTLLSYRGLPTIEGGADPQPDLAAAPPDVSDDGLTWTFRIKRGIHYAPPLQRTEVTAQDFIRAIVRGLSPSVIADPKGPRGHVPIDDSYNHLFEVVQGAREFEEGRSDTVSGLQAQDAHTLQVHLTQPSGDLPYRFAMPQTAPIPPSPTDPTATLGAASGHDGGYGRFLVATGPYMIEGSPGLDFKVPAGEQRPVSGYVPGISLTLVRNPSWDPATDPLRPAYPDRIELPLDAAEEAHDREAADLSAGRIDLAYFVEGEADTENEELVPKYLADPSLRKRLFIYPADFANWLSMNMALPPFDDVHVRRAVNYVIDKRAIQRLTGGHREADPAHHLGWDSLEGGLLSDYDPYGTPDHRGDVQAARAEIRQSAYDSNHDGLCDAPACGKIRSYFIAEDPYEHDLASILRQNLRSIGLALNTTFLPFDEALAKVNDPRSHTGVTDDGGFKSFPSGSSFFQKFAGASGDRSLIGSTPSELRRWGYSVTLVPSVDDRFQQCVTENGPGQVRCWAELDQYLMDVVVPWVPLLVHNRQRIVGPRVLRFSYDQFTTLPSLDRLALKPGTEPSPFVLPSPSNVPAIPEGTYRYTITADDYPRFGAVGLSPDDVRENTGTTTISLGNGHWRSEQTGPQRYFAPVAEGIYSGSGDRVVFQTTRPFINAFTTPEIAWSSAGGELHMRVLGCATPKDQTFCRMIQAIYGAHPWVKVG